MVNVKRPTTSKNQLKRKISFMNVYIYDSFLSEAKYSNTIAKIETRITDLGLNGKIVRLGLLKNVIGAVDNEIRRGAKTIIAVGNNHTINQIINTLAKSDFPGALSIPLAIIPVGRELNEISKFIGINNYNEACEVLSSRRISTLNIVKANNTYFLSQATINNKKTKVDIDQAYSIENSKQGNISIINFPLDKKYLETNTFSPFDNKIELLINTGGNNKIIANKEEYSVFSFKKVVIFNETTPLLLDNCVEVKPPVEICLSRKKLKFIVGKARLF